MHNLRLEEIINEELKVSEFQDFAPNGLQVEGRPHVHKSSQG
ncbi:metal-binding protein [Providencia rettgeri]|nr:metal-binding protein [Providencia rettgeri]